MTDLAREFDSCGECRLLVGGPKKYRILSNSEIYEVVEAFNLAMLYDEKLELIAKLLETIRTIYALRGEDEDVARICNKILENPEII